MIRMTINGDNAENDKVELIESNILVKWMTFTPIEFEGNVMNLPEVQYIEMPTG